MPEFCYQAIDKQGRHLSGSMPAVDETDLHKKLKALGLWLAESEPKRASENTEIQTGAAPKKARFVLPGMGAKKVKRRELVDFCTLLTFQIKAGVPLVQALQATAEDCTDKDFRKVINKLQQHIESGMELHEALACFPDVFDAHFVSVVHAGVISDKLPEILETMKKYLEWVDQVMGEVRQAAMYPSIVLFVVAGFTGFLFTVIIPKFAKLLASVHVPQPLLTQVVLGISTLARTTWWIWLPIIVALFITVPLGRKYSPRFAMAMDRWKLQLPVFGPINLMLALSRFSHNLAILYQSGIPILEALNQCQHGLIGNLYVEEAVSRMATDIKTGSTISEAMHRQQVFSAMLVRMVALGETTGRLDSALNTCGDYYDATIPPRIKKLFALLEPALMLFIIGVVGAVALAIYLPILALMNSVK